jgi:hypothetical protein
MTADVPERPDRVLLVWDAPNMDMSLGSLLGARPTSAFRPRLEDLVAKGACVTVIGFREYANFALTSEVIEFVDLEEIDGVFREPLPRMTLETLPDTGAWLPPFRSLRSLLEPRR